jgi:hypothetical protein
MAINRKVLGRLSRRFLTTPKFTMSRFARDTGPQRHLVGGSVGRRPELKLAGDDAKAVRGDPGSRVRLNVQGIVTSVEGSPRQKPNVVISVESVKQSRGGRK